MGFRRSAGLFAFMTVSLTSRLSLVRRQGVLYVLLRLLIHWQAQVQFFSFCSNGLTSDRIERINLPNVARRHARFKMLGRALS